MPSGLFVRAVLINTQRLGRRIGCGKGFKSMKTSRLYLLVLFFIIHSSTGSHAGMTSWVDENGVRHYSNTAAPEGNATARNIEEIKHQNEMSGEKQKGNKRDRFSVIKMYEEDRKRDKEEKDLADWRRYNKELDRSIEASKRAEKKQQEQHCREAKDRYDNLRSLGWRKYAASQREVRDWQYQIINESHGRIKKPPTYDGKEKTRRVLYKMAVERQEKEVQKACARKAN
jgi:hypothetical protein